MYPTATGYGQYRTQAVETANPAQLVLMLYDGALTAITRAEQALTATQVQTANTELQRAQRIVEELLVSLDTDRGGQIAGNLAALYDFCIDRLTQANLGKDPALLPAVRDTLSGLREAWDRACCTGSVPVAG